MEQKKLKRFKRILSIFVFAAAFITCSALSLNCTNSPKEAQPDTMQYVKPVENIAVIDSAAIRDSIQKAIVAEVTDYLRTQSPKAHKFIPKYLVHAGLTHNIDICFMMAQTQIETNYGTAGAGRESSRRSLFGVVTRKYDNYEIAINDYCKILKKSYLVNGRTEKHLMTKYVTLRGHRYAGNPNYEAHLSKTYNEIVKKTKIQGLQQEWKRHL